MISWDNCEANTRDVTDSQMADENSRKQIMSHIQKDTGPKFLPPAGRCILRKNMADRIFGQVYAI